MRLGPLDAYASRRGFSVTLSVGLTVWGFTVFLRPCGVHFGRVF